MRPKAQEASPQEDLFREKLTNLINLRHPLCRLAELIPWNALNERFGALYTEKEGRPGIATRLMAGLQYLKHAYNLSDEAVMEKAISPPTDSALYHQARRALAKAAKELNIELRQSYTRKSKQALRMAHRYVHARQMKRARREIKRLKVYLGRVVRDLKRKLDDHPVFVPSEITVLPAKTERLLTQQRDSKHKLYAVHAPEAECLAKGKVAKKYEFGVKVGAAVTNRSNFAVGMSALPGNPYDGHTLSDSLTQIEALTGTKPQRCCVDRGYRGHGVTDTEVIPAHHKPPTPAQRRELERRNAIEPVIGHMKSDGRLGRNFLKGALGDAMNAVLCGAGHNLRILLRKLRLFWLWILSLYIAGVSRFAQSNRAAVTCG
jgi:IS5 family transposase